MAHSLIVSAGLAAVCLLGSGGPAARWAGGTSIPGGSAVENLVKDARHGLRLLIKSPVFTIVAVLSLALGIGANTAIFSVINAFMLAPIPVEKPGELVSIFTTDRKNPGPLPTSDLNYRDYRDNNDAFTGLLAYSFANVKWTRNEETK